MKYAKLQIKSSDDGFEDVRHHLINYILNQGEVVLRSPLEEGRKRPGVNEEEFGTIVSDKCVYSYHVEPYKSKGEARTLTIVAASDSKEHLDAVVEQLTNRNSLKLVD